MSTLLVGQSGGPTAVINASVMGVINEAKKHVDHVYGLRYGIEGIINEDFIEISDDISLIPSAYLGSVRFMITDEYPRILEVFKKHEVRYFIYIGGNDSMDTCNKIDIYLKSVGYECSVIGVPKTIDNDLVLTHHSPGYGSAAKYIATSFEELYLDTHSYKEGRVTIVEVMGRDAGWLTASSAIAKLNGLGPDLIYLPEVTFDIEKFLSDVDKVYKKNKKVLVAVSEGIKDKEGNYLLKYRSFNNDDAFGHLQLGGVALVLCEMVNKRLNLPVRAIELNLMQRCAMHIASKTDINEAYNCGKEAVKACLNKYSGYMVTLNDYALKPLKDIATKVKPFPIEWIINENSISDEFYAYVLPLIEGEVSLKFKNGIPFYKTID